MSNPELEVKAEEVEFEDIYDEMDDKLSHMSAAVQNFIQNNYKKLPIEQIVEATHIEADMVEAYIQRYEEFLISRGINPDGKFALTINVDEAGNVGYGIQFPKTLNIDSTANMFGKLLYLITNQKLNESIVRFLLKVAAEHNAEQLIGKVIKEWENQEGMKKKPLIQSYEAITK